MLLLRRALLGGAGTRSRAAATASLSLLLLLLLSPGIPLACPLALAIPSCSCWKGRSSCTSHSPGSLCGSGNLQSQCCMRRGQQCCWGSCCTAAMGATAKGRGG